MMATVPSVRARILPVFLLILCAMAFSGCSLTLDFGKFVSADGGPEAGRADAATDGD